MDFVRIRKINSLQNIFRIPANTHTRTHTHTHTHLIKLCAVYYPYNRLAVSEALED
jgi:hypothetical protein